MSTLLGLLLLGLGSGGSSPVAHPDSQSLTEIWITKDQLKTRYVGKVDPKKHLEDVGQELIEDNIVSVSRQMIDKEATMPKKEGESGGRCAAEANKMVTDEEEEEL